MGLLSGIANGLLVLLDNAREGNLTTAELDLFVEKMESG